MLSFAFLLLMACGGEKGQATDTEKVAEELSATIDSAAVENSRVEFFNYLQWFG